MTTRTVDQILQEWRDLDFYRPLGLQRVPFYAAGPDVAIDLDHPRVGVEDGVDRRVTLEPVSINLFYGKASIESLPIFADGESSVGPIYFGSDLGAIRIDTPSVNLCLVDLEGADGICIAG